VEISDSPKKDLESSVEHEANLGSLMGSLNCLIKSVEQVECPDRSGEQVITSKSLAGSQGSSVKRLASSNKSAWIVDSSDLTISVKFARAIACREGSKSCTGGAR